jgi:hypothetical protein
MCAIAAASPPAMMASVPLAAAAGPPDRRIDEVHGCAAVTLPRRACGSISVVE